MDKIANKKEALEIMESGGIVKFKGHCNMFYFKIVNNSIVTIVDDLENACEVDGSPLFNCIDFFELHEPSKENLIVIKSTHSFADVLSKLTPLLGKDFTLKIEVL